MAWKFDSLRPKLAFISLLWNNCSLLNFQRNIEFLLVLRELKGIIFLNIVGKLKVNSVNRYFYGIEEIFRSPLTIFLPAHSYSEVQCGLWLKMIYEKY